MNANLQPILPRPNLQPTQRPPFNPANLNRFPHTTTSTNSQPRQTQFNPTNFNFHPNQVPQSTTTSFQPNQAQALYTDANLIQFNHTANLSNQVQPPNSTSAQNVLPTPSMSNTVPTWSFPPPPLPTLPSISQPLGPPPVPSGFVFTGASQPLLAPVSGSHTTHVIPGVSLQSVESGQQAQTNQQRAACEGSPGHQVSANQE